MKKLFLGLVGMMFVASMHAGADEEHSAKHKKTKWKNPVTGTVHEKDKKTEKVETPAGEAEATKTEKTTTTSDGKQKKKVEVDAESKEK